MAEITVEAHTNPNNVVQRGYFTSVEELEDFPVDIVNKGSKHYKITLQPNGGGCDMFEQELGHVIDICKDKGYIVYTAKSFPKSKIH